MLKISANVKTKEIILPIGIYLKKYDERFDTCVVVAMDGNDEERVSEKKLRNNGAKIVTALLGRKIIKVGDHDYPKGVGENVAREMFSEDRDTCLFAIRELMRDEMEYEARCPRCSCDIERVVHMSKKLDEISKWGDKEIHNTTNEVGVIAFDLPDGLIVEDTEAGTKLECKKGKIQMPTGKMEENIARDGMKNAGSANTTLLAACVREIENLRRVDEDVIKAMSKADREYLGKLIEEAKCGPTFIDDIECPDCDHKFRFFLQLPYFFTTGRNQS